MFQPESQEKNILKNGMIVCIALHQSICDSRKETINMKKEADGRIIEEEDKQRSMLFLVSMNYFLTMVGGLMYICARECLGL